MISSFGLSRNRAAAPIIGYCFGDSKLRNFFLICHFQEDSDNNGVNHFELFNATVRSNGLICRCRSNQNIEREKKALLTAARTNTNWSRDCRTIHFCNLSKLSMQAQCIPEDWNKNIWNFLEKNTKISHNTNFIYSIPPQKEATTSLTAQCTDLCKGITQTM